jgi:hypothetical protein
MALSQTFDTTVLSTEYDFTAGMSFLPNRSFLRRRILDDRDDLVRRLGLQEIGRVDERTLETTLALLIAAPYHVRAYLHEPENIDHVIYVAEYHRQFARELATEDLVPVEESPLKTESLRGLLARAVKIPCILARSRGFMLPAAVRHYY